MPCSNCAYWKGKDSYLTDDGPDYYTGWCRRGIPSSWKITEDDMWCGEWSEQSEVPNEEWLKAWKGEIPK